MKSIQLLMLTGLALSSAALAQGPADLSGEQIFSRFCASCHGDDARGDGPVAASLSAIVPDLTRIAARNDGEFPAGRVRDTIDGRSLVVAHGTRFMPVWGYEFWIEEGADSVAESEARTVIVKLVEYLRSIQDRPEDERGFGD